MKIFAIADTHLSGQPAVKPMSIFGSHWEGHWEKIKASWRKQVAAEDIVLLAGDISWAMKLSDALVDLDAIANLPGRKIVIRGNHDYWWQTVSKMTKATEDKFEFLNNNFAIAGEWAICGSRGWTCPEDPLFKSKDQAIFDRELLRVEASLSAAQAAGFSQIILMLHFPPFYNHQTETGFAGLINNYQVIHCVYGHLHSESSIKAAATGMINGTTYHLVSCDALDFTVKPLI
ncbi:3',5'-cyclic adenosine monophosphate phosphodiesterase CpdA [Sporomusa ovata DSM 2662]|uniref:Phosphohydrolase n=1 Tax=Sporomusa ovata TaxID=2378 RepID=A0A0U1KYT5_9FIRM|nr:metallophosphoesterase [Sporomusa ovata]EQB29145.1 metallophosphoesterase [Sporomusa ovata DSM 2662]CQR72577.1 Phosphohydrolase [Sporomusa ovata]